MTKNIDKTKLLPYGKVKHRFTTQTIPILDFLKIPPNPFQRPIESRAQKKVVREKFSTLNIAHLQVAIAVLTKDCYVKKTNTHYKKGQKFILDGNTRAYFWNDTLFGGSKSKTQSDLVPEMVCASVFYCDTLDQVRQIYNTFDSPTSLERDGDKIAGMLLRTWQFEAKSDFVEGGSFKTALSYACHCYDPETYARPENCKVESAPGMLAIYIDQIKHVDEIIASVTKKKQREMWDASSFCAALMAFKRYGLHNAKVNEFFKNFANQWSNKKVPSDRFDGATHCVIEWEDHNIFPMHHTTWKRVITIKNAEYHTGLDKTVSFLLYWLEKYMNDQHLISRGPGWDKTSENFFPDCPNNTLSKHLGIDYEESDEEEDLGSNVVKL